MQNLYDPRENKYVKSNNPALILLDLVMPFFTVEQLEKDVYPKIIEYANYCDCIDED